MIRPRTFAFLTACAAAVASTGAFAAQAASVTTYAGSGLSGIADGPALSATFLLPFGVAWDKMGRLYVSDAAAQRVRVVLPDGRVRTLAGSGTIGTTGLWVEGGYADGSGAAAKFNFPTGIAVGSDGDIYVADTNNHVIRRITPNGSVTTFAGNPQVAGSENGSREHATFAKPAGLAFDPPGNLYIADMAGPLRRIARDGTVSTLAAPIPAAFSVSVLPSPRTGIVVGSEWGIWTISFKSYSDPDQITGIGRFVAGPFKPAVVVPAGVIDQEVTTPGILLRNAQAQRSIGYPFAVAALADGSGVVYTDFWTHMVRYLNVDTDATDIIGGQALEDAANLGGGFADGSLAASRFDVPMGIAVGKNGAIAVADSGNKRIRIIHDNNRNEPLQPTGLLPNIAFKKDDYRIAYMGNSYVWTAKDEPDSIGGLVERQLNADRALAAAGKRARVWTVFAPTYEPLSQYVTYLANSHAADAVMIQLNPASVYLSSGISACQSLASEPNSWQTSLRRHLVDFKKRLDAVGIALLLVSQPIPGEISFQEGPYVMTAPCVHLNPEGTVQQLFNKPFAESGVDWLDAWTVFESELRSAHHKPLFLSVDGHFTPHGNEVMARAIVQKLEQLKPWNGH